MTKKYWRFPVVAISHWSKASVAAVLTALLATTAGAQTRIYIAPDDHTDYFWAASPATYRDAFLRTLDHYIARAEADINDGRSAATQSRWNADGSLWLWEYERNRSPADFQRLIDLINSGHISVPLNALVGTDGATPLEAVLRGMYYPGRIERRYGVDFDLAVAMENQTHALGLASLWAGAGARYSWKGVCHCGSIVPDAGDRERPVYWYRGLDGQQILMKWYSLDRSGALVGSSPSLIHPNQGPGGYAEARDPTASVEYVGRPDFRSRYPFDVIGLFGYGWDDVETQVGYGERDDNGVLVDFVAAAENLSNGSRRVIVSNESDFFRDFDNSYGASLAAQTVSFGNDWELYTATLAEVSARVKRALEKLRSAEALAALVTLRRPGFMQGREAARERAWMNFGLYWEHNFGMEYIGAGDPRVAARIAWQRRLADEIESYVETLYADAAAALGGLIDNPGGERFYVFNPLGWVRDDVAELPYDGGPAHAVDVAGGRAVASQRIVRNGQQYLRILAENVPAAGYRVYELRAGDGGFGPAASGGDDGAGAGVLDNGVYRVALNGRGALSSLRDAGGREYIASVNGRLANDIGAGSGAVRVVDAGPVSATLAVDVGGGLARTTRVTLYRGLDRVAIDNTITQSFGDVREWAFGFALHDPAVRHEEVGAVLDARPQSAGGHYSDRARNSRYDWLTLNHFADIGGSDGAGVTLSNADLYFMRLGDSTRGGLDTDTPQLSVLAGGEVVGSGAGSIRDQGGDGTFVQRFALRARAGYDAAAAMRFALEHQNPLSAARLSGDGELPATAFALLDVDDPAVLLWALKPADDGADAGLVARFWHLGDAATSARIDAPQATLRGARRLSHIETPLGELAVDGGVALAFERQQLITVGLTLDLGGGPNPDRDRVFRSDFERQERTFFVP